MEPATDAFLQPHSVIFSLFLNHIFDEVLSKHDTRTIGLSCIGQERLPFTLLFGRAIKERIGVPVLVGGSILSRLFEKGLLKNDWFTKYFDVVVRNEGEIPCEAILTNLRNKVSLIKDVPGIVFLENGRIHSHDPAPPLTPGEVPIPDFDFMPLGRYYSPEITLPILASRGCYWRKCEFCHHGMIYGEKYSTLDAQAVLDMVESLHARYGVTHFSFNDEAVPPEVVSAIGRLFPDAAVSRYAFTALIKFEKYFSAEVWRDLSRIGFKSVYVGLESASERVLKLMKKHSSITTIVQNLEDATRSGIWVHCFLFFGFPGETHEDAKITYEFILGRHDVIGSFGCGTFSLEHNAPIQRHPEAFGLKIIQNWERDLDVYYDYTVTAGLSRSTALDWSDKLNKDAGTVRKYAATNWIHREMLLSLLAKMNPKELVEECMNIYLNTAFLRAFVVQM